MVYKENSNPLDTQGLGLFGRYRHKDDNVNETGNFWSLGFQYEGLIARRDRDVLGFGFVQGFFSDSGGANEGMGYSEDYESVYEVYYHINVTSWLEISPSLQYIVNPGGDGSVSDALIFGTRAHMVF
jgi:carbohydrate-selective porin OprB